MLTEKEKLSQLDQFGNLEGPSCVVLGVDEIGYIRNFFDFYKIVPPPGLMASLDDFLKTPSLLNQKKIRMALCEHIVSDKMFFSHEKFNAFRERAADIVNKEAFESEFLPQFRQ